MKEKERKERTMEGKWNGNGGRDIREIGGATQRVNKEKQDKIGIKRI